MRSACHIVLVLGLVMVALASGAYAQDIVLWRVQSEVSPVMVPRYAGQSSPFPYIAPNNPVAAPQPGTEQDIEAEAIKQQRQSLVGKLDLLLSEGAALAPDTGILEAKARVEGSAGPKVLINNQWMGQGEVLKVPQKFSPQVNELLKQLKEIDKSAESQWRDTLLNRIHASNGASLTLTEIGKDEVKMVAGAGKGRQAMVVPLSISQ